MEVDFENVRVPASNLLLVKDAGSKSLKADWGRANSPLHALIGVAEER